MRVSRHPFLASPKDGHRVRRSTQWRKMKMIVQVWLGYSLQGLADFAPVTRWCGVLLCLVPGHQIQQQQLTSLMQLTMDPRSVKTKTISPHLNMHLRTTTEAPVSRTPLATGYVTHGSLSKRLVADYDLEDFLSLMI